MDLRAREGAAGIAGPGNAADDASGDAAAHQLRDVPQGAFALAGTAVGLLVIGWLLVYFFVFLPRGPVG